MPRRLGSCNTAGIFSSALKQEQECRWQYRIRPYANADIFDSLECAHKQRTRLQKEMHETMIWH